MVETSQNDPHPWDSSTQQALEARLRSINSDQYRRNNEYIIEQFLQFLADERNTTSLSNISTLDCRRYAQHLRKRAQDPDDDLGPSSCSSGGPYFTIVRAFLDWCVKDERVDTNPAKVNRVKDALPEDTGTPDQQFWTPEARDQLLRYADDRAHESLDDEGTDRLLAYRNRALVYMLAYSGARGAEVFRVSGDSKRKGLRWEDIDFDRGVFQVLGKSRDREWLQLPDDALSRLKRYHDVLDPDEDWPVFPSFHAPTLYQRAEQVIEDEQRLDDEDSLDLLRENGGRPKAISTNGARNLMRRLCESAEIDIDGEYLKPHGGRRGLGDQLYEESAELAQEVLRHKSIETTHQSYRETRTEETREQVEEILD